MAVLLVVGEVGGEHLERNFTPEATLDSGIDNAHASPTDTTINVVATEGLSFLRQARHFGAPFFSLVSRAS